MPTSSPKTNRYKVDYVDGRERVKRLSDEDAALLEEHVEVEKVEKLTSRQAEAEAKKSAADGSDEVLARTKKK